jgi:hypothetical protein
MNVHDVYHVESRMHVFKLFNRSRGHFLNGKRPFLINVQPMREADVFGERLFRWYPSLRINISSRLIVLKSPPTFRSENTQRQKGGFIQPTSAEDFLNTSEIQYIVHHSIIKFSAREVLEFIDYK